MNLTVLDEHTVLVFSAQIVVLLAAARALGFVANRLGQPAVVGEITAGLLLGPSVFGKVAPGATRWLFPADPAVNGPLLATAWLGVVLLLVVTGMETDLRLVGRLLKSTAVVPVGSLVLPLAAGLGLGAAMPTVFFGEAADRATFAGFMGVALAMSALPVVARILADLGLMRRNVGQVVVVAAMADDVLGWLLLGALTGAATGRGIDLAAMGVSIIALMAFVLVALTAGQRATDALLRGALELGRGVAGAFSVAVLLALAASAVAQAIGVEAVIGAFLAGIMLGRSRYGTLEVRQGIELMSTAVFAPIFFATAGLAVDLTALSSPTTAVWAVGIFLAASASKLAGAYAGGRLGGLSTNESLAVGVGLNARGALGIVVATVALSVGVFNDASYTAVVLMALATSVMVPPLMTATLRRVHIGPEEAERLAREAVLGESVVAAVDAALLPTRGGKNSALAAEVLDLLLRPEASITVLSVHRGDRERRDAELAIKGVAASVTRHRVERRRRQAKDPLTAILRESELAYGLMAVGVSEDLRETHRLSPTLRGLLAGATIPVLVVRRGRESDGDTLPRRLLVPVTGTRVGQAAEEIAYGMAATAGAEVDVVHVVSRPDRLLLAAWRGEQAVDPPAHGLVTRAVERATRFGRVATGFVRAGAAAREEVLAAAEERGADTIVLGTVVRDMGGEPFLGHGTEYLLEHARQRLIVVVFPAAGRGR